MQNDESIFGVKLIWLMAGFAGGLVSLRYVDTASAWQKCLSVITGTASAAYLSPILIELAGSFEIAGKNLELSNSVEGSIAFLVGVTAMNLIPGFVKLSAVFRNNPEKLLQRDHHDGH